MVASINMLHISECNQRRYIIQCDQCFYWPVIYNRWRWWFPWCFVNWL